MAFFLCISLAIVLIYLNSFIAFKRNISREKKSPFECGYDPKRFARLPFSLHFYLLAVIFLIFDVEITIIIPMPLILLTIKYYNWIILVTTFILILVWGAIHEWKEGALNWTF